MILSDTAIREFLDDGMIQIRPQLDPADIRPVGVRLHLDDELLIHKPGQIVDLAGGTEIDYERVMISDGGYVLEPGAFVLDRASQPDTVPTPNRRPTTQLG